MIFMFDRNYLCGYDVSVNAVGVLKNIGGALEILKNLRYPLKLFIRIV